MIRKLSIFILTVVALTCVAGAQPRRGNPAAGQVLNGVLQGISQAQRDTERRATRDEAERQRREKEWQRQQQAEQRRLQKEAEIRARQLEIQRKKAEADAAKAEAQRLEMQRLQRLSEEQRMQRQLIEDRRRQYEIEQQNLALDRQRWKEESDHEGWFVLGGHIPSWLWQWAVTALIGGIVVCLIRKIKN